MLSNNKSDNSVDNNNNSKLLSIAEINQAYMDYMLPALKELEKEFQDRIKAFEIKYKCIIHVEAPTLKNIRDVDYRLCLSQTHLFAPTYNLMVQLMGLNQQDYPFEPIF